MKTLAVTLACLIAVPVAIVASLGVIVVDVREEGPDRTHLIVPVPLVLASIGLCFIDEDETRVSLPEFAQFRDPARRVIEELANAPDAQLVNVRSKSEEVSVEKVGNTIVVRISAPDQQVRVRLPLAAIRELLDRYDGKGFGARDLLAVARTLPAGEAVHVYDRSQEVRIFVW